MGAKRQRFSDFVEKRDLTLDVKDGLAGEKYDGDYAYPPENPDYRNGVKPLAYQPTKDEGERGKVLVADGGDDKKPLADEMTPGMDKATAEGKPAKPQTIKVKKAKRLTNEEFAIMSQKLSPSEMIQRVKSERDQLPVQTISDLFGNSFTPEPNQTISYLGSILGNSPRMVDRFISECRQQGCLNSLVEGMMNHNSCYESMAEGFSHPDHGKGRAGQLARSLHDRYLKALDAVDVVHESVGPPVDAMFGAPAAPAKEKPKGGAFGGGGGDNTPNPEGNSQGSIFGGPKGNAGSTGGSFGGGGKLDKGGAGIPGVGAGNAPTSAGGVPNFGGGPAPSLKKMMKTETAAGNLFKAAAGYQPLRTLMEGACKDGQC